MSDKRNIATYTLAVSLFCLAAAFVYFTIGLTRLVNQAPAILEGIEKTSKQIEPALKELYKIRELIPPIVTEVTEIRKQIPKILTEVEQVRILVPPILEEVKLTREAVPPILVEVKKTREAIPAMLTRADNLVNKAGNIGKKSSEGAVSGVITGILKAPFKLIGGTGKSVFKSQAHKISDKDRQLIEETALRVLSSANVGETQNWNNPDSGNNGVITLKEIKTIDKRQCSVLTLSINIKNSKPAKEKITSCLSDDNKWELLKEDQ